MSWPCFSFAIHRDGYRFIGIGVAATVVFALISSALAWSCMILTLFCAAFFRNPRRAVPFGEFLVVSPSDGIVCSVSLESPPVEFCISEEKRYRISIFLSIFDVHVNRLPASGKIRNIVYSPGSFLSASLDKSSVFNEKNTVIMEMNDNSKSVVAFSQIAGMIARRIVCEVHEGQDANKGEIFGLIRFGSRCDIWLPPNTSPQVFAGQTMIAGETVIADVSVPDSPIRSGSIL
jgi:phosphatidylserine decarboxylase